MLVARDNGARNALSPLTEYDIFSRPEIEVKQAQSPKFWEKIFKQEGCNGICVGTSDSKEGIAVESAARVAATRSRLPVFVIEDYPGNYRFVSEARTDLLVVENEFVRSLHQQALKTKCPSLWVCKAVRYDPLRRIAAGLRHKITRTWEIQGLKSNLVLWAGQPETEDAVQTLIRLAPTLVESQVCVLLKAHPRDGGYGSGVYEQLFNRYSICYIDVTGYSLDECMGYGPRLVLTQFSSLAVEAGFYGVPSVHILYKDIGYKRLYEKKGFGVPPWCLEDAAFLITAVDHQEESLRLALVDEIERAKKISNFDRYFSVSAQTTPLLAKKIYSMIKQKGA